MSKNLEKYGLMGVNIIKLLMDIPDEKKQKLLKEYKLDNDVDHESLGAIKFRIGHYFDTAVKAAERGATKSEIDRILNHIIVCIYSADCPMDIRKSYTDNNLREIYDKYVKNTIEEQIKHE